jgi:hypothetical protein
MFELSLGNGGWAMAFGVSAAYAFIEFFVIYDPGNYKAPDPDDKND